MATPAAVLSIIVEANTGKAQTTLKKFQNVLRAVDREKATAEVGIDDKGARAKLAALSKDMANFARKSAEAKVGIDKTEFEAQIKSARATLDAVDREQVTPEMNLRLAGLYSDVAKAEAALDAAAHDREVKIDIDRSTLGRLSSIARGADKLSSSFERLGRPVGVDVDVSAFTRLRTAQAALTKESTKLSDVFNRSQLSIGQWTAALAASLPVLVDVGAAAGALTASLGAATAGLGALGVGGAAAASVGLGGIIALAVPAVSSLKDLKTAQDAYTTAVQQYGKHSTQARTAFAKLQVEQKRAGPEAVKFAKTLRDVGRRFRELTQAGQGDLFGAMSDGLDRVNRKLPLLARSANQSMHALRHGFNEFLDRATGPEFDGFIRTMTHTFARSMGPLGRAFGNIALVLQRIAVAVAPDLIRAFRGFEDMTRGWVESTRNAGKLRETIHGLVNQANTWRKLIQAAADLIIAVLVPGMGQGQKAVEGITAKLQEWTRWVNQHPKEMRDFFKDGLKTTKLLAEVLIGFIPQLFEISKAMRPIARAFLGITKALNSLKVGNVSALTVLLGLFIGGRLIRGVQTTMAALGAGGLMSKLGGTGGATAGTAFLKGWGGKLLGAAGIGAVVFEALTTEGGILDDLKGEGVTLGKALSDSMVKGFQGSWDQGLKEALMSGGAGGIAVAIKDTGLEMMGTLASSAAGRLKQFAETARQAADNARLLGDTAAAHELSEIARQAENASLRLNNVPRAYQAIGRVLKDKSTLSSKPLIDAVIKPLEQMTPAARRATVGMLREQARTLRDKGQITKSEYRRFMAALEVATKTGGQQINAKWRDVFNALADTTQNKSKKVQDAFGKNWTNFLAEKPWKGVVGDWREAFKKLADTAATGAQKVRDAFGPGSPWDAFLHPKGKIRGPKTLPGMKPSKGAHGGLVTSHGIVRMASGGVVPGSGNRDTVPALLTPGEVVIPKDQARKGEIALEGKGGKKVLSESKKIAKATGRAISDELGKGNKEAGKDTKDFVKKHGKQMDVMRDTSKKATKSLRSTTIADFQETNQSGSQAAMRLKDNTTESMNRAKENSIQASGKLKAGVSSDYRSMAGAVGEALNKVEKLTNKALKALGVKPVNFGVVEDKGKGKQRGGVVGRQTGGMVVPGHGTGDKVPLRAMVEPGEIVHVLNKNASKQIGMLEGLNQKVPRFQTGGMQGPASSLARKFVSSFGGSITSGLRPGDPGFHGRGMAFDWAGGDWDAASRYSNQIGTQLAEGIHQGPPGQNVSWDSGAKVSPSFWGASTWAAHVNHIHIAVGQMVEGAISAAAEKVKRVKLEGAKGPLLDIGQASVDKVRSAANRYIEKKTPSGSDAALLTGSGDVEKIFAETAKKLSTSKTATLALGMAGFAESGMKDLSYGDSTSQGALQLLASTAASMNIDPHDEAAISSAFLLKGYFGKGGANKLADQGLPAHLVAQGVQGSADSSGSNYAAQTGSAKAWMNRFGLQKGGLMAPFVGAYQDGGPVMKTGLGLLHQGEHVVPKMAKGGKVPGPNFDVLPFMKKLLHGLLDMPTASWGNAVKKEFHKLHAINDRNAKQQKRIEALRERRRTAREDRRAVKALTTHGGPQALGKALKLIGENGVKFSPKAEKKLEDLMMQRRHHNLSREERREMHNLQQRQGEAKKQDRMEARIREQLQLEKTMIEQFKVLTKELAQRRKEKLVIEMNGKEVGKLVADPVASEIGAMGLNKGRQAAAGTTARY